MGQRLYEKEETGTKEFLSIEEGKGRKG